MSETIKNVYEITGKPILRDRTQLINLGVIGLGPDDLVCVEKQEKAFLQSPIIVFYYHHICGMNLNNINSFSKYFQELIKKQEKGSYLPFSKTYTITKGRLFVFNCFTKSDVCIVALPKQDNCKITNQKKEEIELTDELSRQIKISIALRYYRTSQPLLYAIFGSRFINSYALRVFKLEYDLTYDDFCYAVENLSISDDLMAALSLGILISLNTQQATAFLFNYQNKIPGIFNHLSHFIPPHSIFYSVFHPLLEDHYFTYCDDLETAISLFNYYIDNNMVKNCSKLFPLIFGSMLSHPLCSISLAKYSLCQALMHEASKPITTDNYAYDHYIQKTLIYLNTACYSNNWPTATYSSISPTTGKANHDIKFNNPSHELKIINSPLVGVNFEYFKAVYKLIQIPNFLPNWKRFQKTHIYSYSHKNLVEWPKMNFEIKEDKREELYLYDPGIEMTAQDMEDFQNEECDPLNNFQDIQKINCSYLESLPLHPFLTDSIKDAQSMLERKTRLLQSQFTDKTDIFGVILLSLRVNDNDLFNKCFQFLLKKKMFLSGTEKILLLYAKFKGFDFDYDTFKSIPTKPAQTELNGLILLEDIIKSIENLSKTS